MSKKVCNDGQLSLSLSLLGKDIKVESFKVDTRENI